MEQKIFQFLLIIDGTTLKGGKVYLFRVAPYWLSFALHKDWLFH
jgi:hypothetical protein